MKKLLLLLFSFFSISHTLSAQCATSYPVANDCTSWGDVISYFELNSLTATGNTGCSPSGYASFASPVWNLQPGGTYTFAATLGIGTDDEGLAIWIDLNNDGNYAASEMLYSAQTPSPTQFGSITIPVSATIASNMRMRVMCGFQYVFTGTDACVDFVSTWGETEDHVVNIVCPNAAGLSIAVSNTLVCLGNTATLTASGLATYTWTGGVTNGSSFSPQSTQAYTLTAGITAVGACPAVTTTAVRTISVTSTPLTLTVSATPTVICAGSSATLQAGTAAGYTWMPGNLHTASVIVSAAATTVYTLTGANATGCPGTANISLSVQALPNFSIAVATSTVICNGDLVNLAAVGNAVTYTWSPNTGQTGAALAVTPNNTSVFSVTGSNAAGCTATKSQVIVVNQNPVLTVSVSNPTVCSNGSSTLTAAGAIAYQWTNGASTATTAVSPPATAVYSVTGTNTNTCHSTTVVTVHVFEPALTVSSNTSVCMGFPVTLSADGADSYLWLNTNSSAQVITPVPAVSTIYTVTGSVSENFISCAATNTVEVEVLELPVITISGNPAHICTGQSITLTANGAGTYTWAGISGNTPAVSVTPVATRVYAVSGTAANGCKNTATVQTEVTDCTGFKPIVANGMRLQIYPNPSQGDISISTNVPATLMLVNEWGQPVRLIAPEPGITEVKIKDLACGVYFVTATHDYGSVTQKVIVTD